jgi:hypothetical protein
MNSSTRKPSCVSGRRFPFSVLHVLGLYLSPSVCLPPRSASSAACIFTLFLPLHGGLCLFCLALAVMWNGVIHDVWITLHAFVAPEFCLACSVLFWSCLVVSRRVLFYFWSCLALSLSCLVFPWPFPCMVALSFPCLVGVCLLLSMPSPVASCLAA